MQFDDSDAGEDSASANLPILEQRITGVIGAHSLDLGPALVCAAHCVGMRLVLRKRSKNGLVVYGLPIGHGRYFTDDDFAIEVELRRGIYAHAAEVVAALKGSAMPAAFTPAELRRLEFQRHVWANQPTSER